MKLGHSRKLGVWAKILNKNNRAEIKYAPSPQSRRRAMFACVRIFAPEKHPGAKKAVNHPT